MAEEKASSLFDLSRYGRGEPMKSVVRARETYTSGIGCFRQAPSAYISRSRLDRDQEAKTKNVVIGFLALAALLIATGLIYVEFTQIQKSSTEVVAQINYAEREQIRSIEIVDCVSRVLAGQDSRLAASNSRVGRGELARQYDQVVQYCQCACKSRSHLFTKDDFIKQWIAEGRAYRERSPLMEERSSTNQSGCARRRRASAPMSLQASPVQHQIRPSLWWTKLRRAIGTDVGRPPAMRDRTGSCGLQTTPQIDLTTSARGVAPMQGSRPFGVKTERKIRTATSDARRPSVPAGLQCKMHVSH